MLMGPDLFAFDVEPGARENRVYSIANWTGFFLQTHYGYDAGGEMAFRRTTSWYYGGVDTKYTFMDGIFEERSHNCNAVDSKIKHYSAFGRVFATRDGGSMGYLVADHLGSTVGHLNSAGYLTEARYYPFGTLRFGYGNTSRMFTGQQSEVGALGSQVHAHDDRAGEICNGALPRPRAAAKEEYKMYSILAGT
jgi:hypothetical protein